MRRRVGAFAAALLACAAIACGPAAAYAADDPTVQVAWTDASVSTEYGIFGDEGSSWSLRAHVTGDLDLKHYKLTRVDVTGAPSGWKAAFGSYRDDSDLTFYGYVFPPSDTRPLPVGTYSFTATFTDADGTGTNTEVTPPATLTVSPAKVAVVCTVKPDPTNPANAIIAADLTGRFFDSAFSFAFDDSPVTPAGTWAIVVKDAGGAVVHEATVDRDEGSSVSGVTSYWADVPPGEYVARASFTPSGSAASNFTFTQAGPVQYSAAPQPGSTSTAQPAPPAPPPADDAGPSLPAWIPVAAGVLSAALLALLIVQIVRLRRVTRTPAEARS